MPAPAALLDMSLSPLVHGIDERWTMADAAGLGDHSDCYLDTTRLDGVVAHPLFLVGPPSPSPTLPAWVTESRTKSCAQRTRISHR
jgi:hypothetical protein